MESTELISERQRIEQDHFFARMDEFGFFDRVSEHLPADFSAVFEIARVIEDMNTSLGEQLAPVMMMQANDIPEEPPPTLIPTLLPAEEYEADLIRTVQELPAIYPYQFLLPENVFYQKLVERSLWLPRPRPPRTFRYQSDSDIFKPDHRKQKVYVLFDVSKSMNLNWRIHVAKAIAYIFLTRNMKELGTVYFRTFADTIGDLQKAHDVPSFRELISSIMHQSANGKGTALNKALLTAIEDIRSLNSLSDSEILVITDGAAHIELARLRELMGANIRLNTVKIGDEHIVADAKFVQYHLKDANTDEAKRLAQLQEKRRELASAHDATNSGNRKQQLARDLSMLDRQIATVTERVAEYITKHYGSEIIELSNVYVNVDDIEDSVFLSLDEERRQQLEELATALLITLEKEQLSEDVQRAALLYDHLELLLEHSKNDPEMEKLSKQKEAIKQRLQHILAEDEDIDPSHISISSFDKQQLLNMLTPSVSKNPLSLAKVIKILLRKFKTWLAQQRQVRRARIIFSRKKKV